MNRVLIMCAVCAMGLSCSKPQVESEETTGGKPVLYTVNYPLQYFAERIGGDLVDVRFPAPADEDPAYWSPGAEAVSAYQKADLILLNGAGYARWVDKVSLPAARLVHTGKAFTDQLIELDDQTTHTHGPGGKHAHGGFAFTAWLDPTLAIEQARAIRDALKKVLPDQVSQLEQGFAGLEKDLRAMDDQIQILVAENSNRPLLFSHPVYQYFESHYGLNGQSVHWEPDEMPDDKMWRELKEVLASHPARWMVWEGDPLPATEEKLREMGIESLVFDPCGNEPETGDYFEVMRANADRLQRVFTD